MFYLYQDIFTGNDERFLNTYTVSFILWVYVSKNHGVVRKRLCRVNVQIIGIGTTIVIIRIKIVGTILVLDNTTKIIQSIRLDN